MNPDKCESVTLASRSFGKLRAVIEHATVRSDMLLASGIKNPVVIYAASGRSGMLRKMLDDVGAKAVQVRERQGCTARPWRSCSRPDGQPLRHWARKPWTNYGASCAGPS